MQNIVHQQLLLYTLPDKFVIEPLSKTEAIVIDRISNEIVLSHGTPVVENYMGESIYGIWGILHLASGPHLIIIKQRKLVGNLFGHDIWQVTESSVLSFARSNLHMTERMVSDNNLYLQMVEQMLNTESFYFSYTFDLTHSQQRLSETSPEFRTMSLAERADERFVWNHYLLSEMMRQPELSRYCLPILHGFVSICSFVLDTKALDYCLISRRSRFRAGVRFFVRGADEYGHSANYVETEQLLHASSCRFSFVITRGSIPLIWRQSPNLFWIPPFHVHSDPVINESVFVAHINDQIYTHKYGKQILINLVNSSGKERPLGKEYGRLADSLNPDEVQYEYFDFHHECSKMRWDRLAILMDRTLSVAQQMSYFETGADGSILRLQRGVFRVNCIDCLDRSNVVQSMFARRALIHQLRSLNFISIGAVGLPHDIDVIFKNVWADNADIISKQYSGTGALKSDFTRTGKRTKYGAFMDGINAVTRYVKNNFYDGFRQDSLDLFLGNYIPDQSQTSPFAEPRDWKTWFLPIVLFIGLAMVVFCMLLPPEHWSELILFLLFWGSFVMSSMFGIIYYGSEFIDKPKLLSRSQANGSFSNTHSLNTFKVQ